MDPRAISMISCCERAPMLRVGKTREEAWHPIRIGSTVLPVFLYLHCRGCGRMVGPGTDELQVRLAWENTLHEESASHHG